MMDQDTPKHSDNQNTKLTNKYNVKVYVFAVCMRMSVLFLVHLHAYSTVFIQAYSVQFS